MCVTPGDAASMAARPSAVAVQVANDNCHSNHVLSVQLVSSVGIQCLQKEMGWGKKARNVRNEHDAGGIRDKEEERWDASKKCREWGREHGRPV